MYKEDNAKLNNSMLNFLLVSSFSFYLFFCPLRITIFYQLSLAKCLQFCELGEFKGEKTKE